MTNVSLFTKAAKSVAPGTRGDLCLTSSFGLHGGLANGCLMGLCVVAFVSRLFAAFYSSDFGASSVLNVVAVLLTYNRSETGFGGYEM